jgi:2-polyprenyl-3-methyl-5-hydroxy-6-metoxy-1,4-benzoquinol methylase
MEYPNLAGDVIEIWNQNASWWSSAAIDRQPINTLLMRPTLKQLLDTRDGDCVLDLACGNGWLARDLAASGIKVVACDASEMFLRDAKSYPTVGEINYIHVDLTSEEHLSRIPTCHFDAVVCCMALMDIPDIRPMLTTIGRALKPSGRFVFSIPHPCFHSPSSTIVAERRDLNGQAVVNRSIKINSYLNTAVDFCSVLKDQPKPHYYFHRPLGALLTLCFECGLVLNGFLEPTTLDLPARDVLGWGHFIKEIPPLLVARLVLRGCDPVALCTGKSPVAQVY